MKLGSIKVVWNYLHQVFASIFGASVSDLISAKHLLSSFFFFFFKPLNVSDDLKSLATPLTTVGATGGSCYSFIWFKFFILKLHSVGFNSEIFVYSSQTHLFLLQTKVQQVVSHYLPVPQSLQGRWQVVLLRGFSIKSQLSVFFMLPICLVSGFVFVFFSLGFTRTEESRDTRKPHICHSWECRK